MSERPREGTQVDAQDVIDALRLAFMAQDDEAKRAKLTNALLNLAPETDSNRGVQLLIDLIVEGSLIVEVRDVR